MSLPRRLIHNEYDLQDIEWLCRPAFNRHALDVVGFRKGRLRPLLPSTR
jgi:hypothetical protein